MAQMTQQELYNWLLQNNAIQQGRMPTGSSFQTGANDGYVVNWAQAPGQNDAYMAAVADPAGFQQQYQPPTDWTPQIGSMNYVPDWQAATKAANNGGFMADYGWAPMLAAGGLAAFGGLGAGAAGVGSADGATAGLYGLESGGAGVGAADLGMGYGGAGAAGAAGSGGMDELMQQYLSAGYTPEQASYFAQSDLANEGLYNASNYSGAMVNSAMPEVISPGSSMWDSVQKYITQNPGSTAQTALKALGALGASALGAYASNKQTNALQDQSNQYMAMGQPYRDKLAALYADPSSFIKSDAVQVPVQQGTNALMRSLSMSGNPFGSGNALQQGQNYATNSLYDKLGQEKDRLAGFGGLSSYNQAAPQAATNAIGSSAGTYNAIGSGIGNIFNPPQTAAQQMTALAQAMKGNYGAGY